MMLRLTLDHVGNREAPQVQQGLDVQVVCRLHGIQLDVKNKLHFLHALPTEYRNYAVHQDSCVLHP